MKVQVLSAATPESTDTTAGTWEPGPAAGGMRPEPFLGWQVWPGTSGLPQTRQALCQEDRAGVRFDPSHGKGSHGRLYISDRFTTVKRGELSRAMLAAMIRQLGIKKEEF